METETTSVNRAFSRQSLRFDDDDRANGVLQDMRNQVYSHVANFIVPKSNILELNAGTGIDALYFVQHGHTVHATDLADGMVDAIKKKIKNSHLESNFTCQQLSFDSLEELGDRKFDYVFSNFGGLNCIDDLAKVTCHLPALLMPGAFVTFVIMPPVSVWELMWVLSGRPKAAFRRFTKDGVLAHLEGEYFRTFYHSLSEITRAFGPSFRLVSSEGLCSLSPPPSRADFPLRHRRLYRGLRKIDAAVRHVFPFNRWADHIIVTFQFRS